MTDGLSVRQMAIRLRVAGESAVSICSSSKRSSPWFHKWRQPYLAMGPEGLYKLARADQRVTRSTVQKVARKVTRPWQLSLPFK